VADHLLSKNKTLSSNPTAVKNREREDPKIKLEIRNGTSQQTPMKLRGSFGDTSKIYIL
jgi:hypothetical protein